MNPNFRTLETLLESLCTRRLAKEQEQLHEKQGVCHTLALSFTLKGIFRQKKNVENSNISPMQKL
jgi:hypothetical protein